MSREIERKLTQAIEQRDVRCGVIGLGYVGLPLATVLASAGFDVTGFDIVEDRCVQLNDGCSYIKDVDSARLSALVAAGRFRATTDFSALAGMDTINICVPTPLRKTKDPDVSFIVSAVEEIARHLRAGQLVILESTTYPGTTEELIVPILEKTGLRAAVDFFVAFSPERVDPGNSRFQTRNIPKVVGGYSESATRVAVKLYEASVEQVVPVSSTRVAEMVKLHENTFRSVNIGMVNELALMCNALGIDVWEVVDAAATKPFGFMAFYPGPGLGGHCIPIDPFYLSWKAKQHGFEARFIELAGHVNTAMPKYVATRVSESLNSRERAVRGARVLLLGVAYKPDVDDLRESPALDVLAELRRWGATVSYCDPLIPSFEYGGESLESLVFSQGVLDQHDCVVILTDHSGMNYGLLEATDGPVVVDTRNALKGVAGAHIFRL